MAAMNHVPDDAVIASDPRNARLVARALLPFLILWRTLVARFGNGYRPERHYMRGPGPKWHERNSANPNDEGSGATARQQLGVLNG